MRRGQSFGLVMTLACVAMVNEPSAASSATSATITHIQLNKAYPNVVFIKLNVPPSGKPTCSAHYWDYTLALTTAFDEKLYATLLAAHLAGSLVDLSGTNACTEIAQIESLQAAGPHN